MKIQYDPDSIFEQNEQKGGSCEIKNFWQNVSASSSFHELIPADSGKKHRILVLNAIGVTATNSFVIVSGGVTTTKSKFQGYANIGGEPPTFLKAEKVGICEGESGDSITANTGVGSDVVLSGRYITLIG